MNRVLLLITAFVCLFDSPAWARGSSANARGGGSTASWMPFLLTQESAGEVGAPQVNALPEWLQSSLRLVPNKPLALQASDPKIEAKSESDPQSLKQTQEQNLTRLKDLEAKKEDLWARAKAKQNASWTCSVLGLSCRSVARDELNEIDELSGQVAVLRRDIDDIERTLERQPKSGTASDFSAAGPSFKWIGGTPPCAQPLSANAKGEGEYTLVVCLNADQRLQSAHVIKADSEVLRSEIQRATTATIERVRILDTTQAVLEDHEWSLTDAGQPRYTLRFISSSGESVTVSAEQTR